MGTIEGASMKNIIKFSEIIVLAAVLLLAGCSSPSGSGNQGGNNNVNLFIGTWVGNVKFSGSQVSMTLEITDSTWNLNRWKINIPGSSEPEEAHGTYQRSGDKADLFLSQHDSSVGSIKLLPDGTLNFKLGATEPMFGILTKK